VPTKYDYETKGERGLGSMGWRDEKWILSHKSRSQEMIWLPQGIVSM